MLIGGTAHEGVSDELRRAFLVYIISHNRPMAEILAPNRKPLRREFEWGFVGIAGVPVDLEELEAAREAIIAAMVGDMSDEHRRFLLGFKRGEPDWSLLGIPEAQHLPAVRWKQQNLARVAADKRRELADTLKRVLFSS